MDLWRYKVLPTKPYSSPINLSLSLSLSLEAMEKPLKRKHRKGDDGKTQHCERLRRLLLGFIHQHNWKDASGVLSVLLHADQTSPEANRTNYVAAMELLVREEEHGMTMKLHNTVKNISDLWYRKNGPMKKSPKQKYSILLEFLFFCLSHKKIDDANIAMTSMTQDPEFATDSVLNLIVGLVYYQLWYSSIPEEMKLNGSNTYGASTMKDLSGLVSYDSTCCPTSSNKSTVGDTPMETSIQDFQWDDLYVLDSYSEEYGMQSTARHDRDMQRESSCEDLGLQDLYVPDSVESSYQDFGLQDLYVADSVESSALGGPNDEKDNESSSRGDSVSSTTTIVKELHAVSPGETKGEPSNRVFRPQDFYCAYSEEMSGDSEDYYVKKDSIFKFHGCDVSLLPLRLPKLNENFGKSISRYLGTLNENYIKGVKHLRVALYSTPPLMASLLPLVQLLLLGDQVEEAKKELENICKTSDSVRPLRIRANLLECVDSKNSTTLSACYENILNKDPACCHSVGRLITIHKNGYYGVLPLLEMISLHLDVTKGTRTIWEELASCFLKLSRPSFEEDKLSVCGDEEEDEDGDDFPLRSKLWQYRCEWYWPEQHFNSYTSEQGDLKLLTVKAACASHIYGPGCKYTRSAFDRLEKEKKTSELMCYLELHMNSSVNVSNHI